MSKGSERRPTLVDDAEVEVRWTQTFKKPPKVRVEEDECDGCPERRRGQVCVACDLYREYE